LVYKAGDVGDGMIRRTYDVLRTLGMKGLAEIVVRRVIPRRLACYERYKPLLENKIGLEIGGPSGNFKRRGLLPVYPIADRIDNCNFGSNTTWEGRVTEGPTFHYDKRHSPGIQYVAEATDLRRIASSTYDFVLSSHTLEHVANPLKALAEWIRVTKEQGLVVLILPHRDGTFDHKRPVTSLAHLMQDLAQEIEEDDLTHLEEILRLHDMSRDPDAGDFESFRQRSENNLENRCLHHHVFDTRLAVELAHHVGLQILAVEVQKPYDICVMAQKPILGRAPDNARFRGIDSTPFWQSPFPSDRP
jgi:SAM-dependent methyltransferase